MLFRVLLWALGRRIEWLARNDVDFKKSIAKRRCVLQFQTEDRSIARYYSFSGGKTQSVNQLHERPSLIFVFESPRVVRQLMMDMAKAPDDRALFMNAMNRGQIRIQGDISLLTWFMTLSDHFAPSR